VWATTDTFAVGDDLVRIRTNTPEAGAAVRRLLGDRLVDDVEGDFLYAVRLEPPVRGEQPLHVLYENGCVVRRSRDPERILAMLLAHVTGRETVGTRGPLQLAGVAVVGPRGAALLPLSYESSIAPLERRLAAAGLRLVDSPILLFDAVNGDLLVPEVPAIDPSLLAGVDVYRRPEPGAAVPGRHRVRGWLLEDLRGADDVRRPALQLVLNAEAITVERARRLVERIQSRAVLVPAWQPRPDDLVAALVRLADGKR
jgi:hypothetical protein